MFCNVSLSPSPSLSLYLSRLLLRHITRNPRRSLIWVHTPNKFRRREGYTRALEQLLNDMRRSLGARGAPLYRVLAATTDTAAMNLVVCPLKRLRGYCF